MSEPVKEDLPDIATIQPDRLIKYRISEDRFSGEVLLPGLWYTDFDRKIAGKWTLSAISNSLELVRLSILIPHGAFYSSDLISDGLHAWFFVNNEFNIEKRVHYILRDDIWGYIRPFRFVAYLSGVGKTSITVTQDMFDHKLGHKLKSSTTKLVYVDKNTRKPCPLPRWFSDRAKAALAKRNMATNKATERINAAPLPANAFCYKVKGLKSDCDRNSHVNQSVYLKWCSDVGALAADWGKYNYFKKNIGKYAIESIRVEYLGEALMDDILNVYTWEDQTEERTLRFVMKKNDSVIFNAKLKYYDDVIADETSHVIASKM